jgi:hypothetical protein
MKCLCIAIHGSGKIGLEKNPFLKPKDYEYAMLAKIFKARTPGGISEYVGMGSIG